MNTLTSLIPLAWPAAFLAASLVVVFLVRDTLRPIVAAVVSGIADNARRNAGNYMTGVILAFAASTTALEKVAENMHWIYVAAAAQVLNPGLVAIIAFMRPAPIAKTPSSTTPPFPK